MAYSWSFTALCFVGNNPVIAIEEGIMARIHGKNIWDLNNRTQAQDQFISFFRWIYCTG